MPGAVVTAEIAHDARARLGEGVTWSTTDGVLLWVDVAAHVLHRFDTATGQPAGATTYDESLSFVASRAAGGHVLGLGATVTLTDTAGAVEQRIALPGEPPGNRTNDAAVDGAGRLYQGTMAADIAEGRGALHRVDPDGRAERLVDGITISNGIGWSLDDTQMYYIDTLTSRVDVFDYDAGTGAIEGRRPFVEIDPTLGLPDGMCVDSEGCLWVALFNGSQVQRFSPTGEPLEHVEVPDAPQVTCCEFGGPGLDRLYVTTARIPNMGGSEHAARAGALFVADVNAVGRPPNAFAG